MRPNPCETLCTRCGLCCDGSLFADVELAHRTEASALEALRLDVEEDPDNCWQLLQPCVALKGRRCSIYPHRPDCCRTFECRLLQQVKHGQISVEKAKKTISKALRRIGEVKALLASFNQQNEALPLMERAAEALELSTQISGGPEIKRNRRDLKRRMKSLDNLLHKTFLAH